MASSATVPAKCEKCVKVGIYLGIAEAVIFMVLKVTFGIAFGSRALIAASLYSLQDLIASLIAVLGMTVARKPPDAEHPYGHGKAEYVGVGLMSVLMLLGIVALIVTALSGVFDRDAAQEAPGMTAMWIAVLCGVVCWFLSEHAACGGRKLNSPALLSCSQHLHGDLVASAAVVVSVIGAQFGYVVLDHIVAVAEAVHIVAISGRMLGTALNGLMDTSAPPELVRHLRRSVGELGPVVRVREVRARWAGQSLLAQVSVEVDGRMKVAEAQVLRSRIEKVVGTQANSKAFVRIVPAPGGAAASQSM